jgi:hypothetical protein
MNPLLRVRMSHTTYIATLALICFLGCYSLEGTTVKRNTNLRKSSATSSQVVELLDAGTEVTLISNGKRAGYYQVRAPDGAVGWAWAKNISLSAEGVSPTPQPTGVSPTPPPTGQAAFDPGCTLPFDSIKKKHPIIDDTCGIDGSKEGGGPLSESKLAENHAKNNFCLTGAPVEISYDDLLGLQRAVQNLRPADLGTAQARHDRLTNVIAVNGQNIGEGTLVRLVTRVLKDKADYADTAKQGYNGESVNCYRLSEEENDIHIPLGTTTDLDECQSVTAEMTPHFRPKKWTPENINSVGEHPVRITGHLFYDSSHTPCTPQKRILPPRASVWEIHPVYVIEVCSSTDINACKSAPDSSWKALDHFAQR